MIFPIQDYKEAFLFGDSFKTLSMAPDAPKTRILAAVEQL
jgi:hypothetical protein